VQGERDELEKEAEAGKMAVEALEEQETLLSAKIGELGRQNTDLEKQNSELEGMLDDLVQRCVGLERQVEASRGGGAGSGGCQGGGGGAATGGAEHACADGGAVGCSQKGVLLGSS